MLRRSKHTEANNHAILIPHQKPPDCHAINRVIYLFSEYVNIYIFAMHSHLLIEVVNPILAIEGI